MPEERKILGSSKITRSNQVTLPPEVREDLNVQSGDKIAFYKEKDGKITIQR
ncbi:MAG: AbrB/MazE/SpoVT family DNA-binding domain-containing protein [Candidatus Odinarchaeota archaeon]